MIALSQIKDPSDIRPLSVEECEELADDIRTKIIQTVAQNGGHLASNLGAVEITLALHRVFDTPRDKIIFDVGHQSYTHKLLTGRYNAFDSLRTYGGIAGFPRRTESEYDLFDAGHASTSISQALGMARARDAQGQKHHVVAVVGDGALTGGMCYEALNDCGNSKTRLIVLLNDNEMSIAKNVGALSKYLARLRASAGWNLTKKNVRTKLSRIPAVGQPLYRLVHKTKQAIKSVFVNEVDEGFFSALGFRYLGPVNGNDLADVEKMLKQAKQLDEPVVVHCLTKKGYGYHRAETKPEAFHGTPPFLVENGRVSSSGAESNGKIAVDTLIQLAEEDKRIMTITAAMPLGTCTAAFEKAYPDRFLDVGIAEEHAVSLCAGLAAGGMRPYFFVYSTFLQRAYDQLMNDACILNLPVVCMLDRSGISNEDGQTHQGLYDFAYLRHIPNLVVLAPADGKELQLMIRSAHRSGKPCTIRYPKSAEKLPQNYQINEFEIGKWQQLRKGSDIILLATGTMTAAALRVADSLAQKKIDAEVINASTIKPLDLECLSRVFASGKPIYTIEEHVLQGGFGSAVLEAAAEMGERPAIVRFGVEDRYIQHGDHKHLLAEVGLDDESIAQRITNSFIKEVKNDG